MATVGSILDDAYQAARRAIEFIGRGLADAGAGLQTVARTGMFLKDVSQFQKVARAHGDMFGDTRPATPAVKMQELLDAAVAV
jgi:enamine deaminase RidA (YjgF/YER057c/UK114 family)